MVRYLLDTNVVSDLNKGIAGSPGRSFVEQTPLEQMWLSVITIGEIRKGASAMPIGKRRTNLQGWLDKLELEFAERILAIDLETSHIWGELVARTKAEGFEIGVPDLLIAATAIQHGMHVVTRNVKDFEPTGVLLINPWEMEG
jgi:hypothetical protein